MEVFPIYLQWQSFPLIHDSINLHLHPNTWVRYTHVHHHIAILIQHMGDGFGHRELRWVSPCQQTTHRLVGHKANSRSIFTMQPYPVTGIQDLGAYHTPWGWGWLNWMCIFMDSFVPSALIWIRPPSPSVHPTSGYMSSISISRSATLSSAIISSSCMLLILFYVRSNRNHRDITKNTNLKWIYL